MNREKEKDRAEIFVKHIEDHLKKMSPEERGHGKVMCKICGKTIDDIVREETKKGIWIADGVYQLQKNYIDRNGLVFKIVPGLK